MQDLTLLAAATAVLVLVFVLLRACVRLDSERTVLLRVPRDLAWEFVRHFPTLHAAHSRARVQCPFDEYRLQRGDGETTGSIWRARGRWRGEPCWAEIELVRCVPGEELAFRLVRDSFGTHRGLADHRVSLTLEENGPGTTKLTWRLRARLLRPRLWAARLLASKRLRARLLDVGLRSIKTEVESARRGLAAEAPQVEPGQGQPIGPVAKKDSQPATGSPSALPAPSAPPGGKSTHPVK